MKELKTIRKKINRIDKKIKKNYLKRLGYSKEIAKIKQDKNLPIYDENREREILDNLLKDTPLCYRDYLLELYSKIFSISKDFQGEILKDKKEEKFCLIGEKLSHSYSKEIHNRNNFSYELKEVSKDKLNEFMLQKDYKGFNITIPYKESVLPYLYDVSIEAKKIGAVNTILKKGNKLFGYNTDYFGFSLSLKKCKVNIENKNVAILGSGATSKMVEYYCKEHNAKKITIVSRSGKVNYQNCYQKLGDIDILINTTPCGMYPQNAERIIDISKFKNLRFVFDCIYNPLKTGLLLDAERLNIKNSNGLYMLVAQAFYAESIWRKSQLSSKQIDLTYKELLKEKQNIVLYGMAGAGKTTIGEMLAKELNRKFFDTDRLFFEKFNILPSDYIVNNGEEKFREKENEIIKEISKITNSVVSLGGGSVLRDENVEFLKQNGIMIYIKRNLKNLSITDRPLSKEKGIKGLYLDRKKQYEKIKTIVIKNNKDIDNAVNKIKGKYENFSNKWC